jgi:hypothetical protein
LHSFSPSGSEGAGPQGSLALSDEVLYGTTLFGSFAGAGAVFALPAPAVYFITPAVAGAGGIAPAGSQAVTRGGSATFTMQPAAGHHVHDVLVDGISVGPVVSYTFADVQSDHSIAVTFAVDEYSVTVSMGGTGSGVVSSVPPGIDCEPTCSASFPIGTGVTLSATPATNSTFDGWAGHCSGAGPCQLGADEATTFSATATFSLIPAPVIMSPDHATFTVNTPGSFTVVATGIPSPELSVTGVLPGGVAFTDLGGGSGALAGTPQPGTAGDFPLTVTAHNGAGADAIQVLTLTVVDLAPGDVNGDGKVSVGDVFFLINHLFAGGLEPIGPGDVDGDGTVTVQDLLFLINFLFAGGAAPP